MGITIIQLLGGGYEVTEGAAAPRYKSELGFDSDNNQNVNDSSIFLTNINGNPESKGYTFSNWSIGSEGGTITNAFVNLREVSTALSLIGVTLKGSGSSGGGGGTNIDTSSLAKESFQITGNAYLELDNWTNIAGNSIEYTYYTGVEANNPSGTGNIKDIIYKKNNVTEITQTFVFNANDDIINTIVT